MSLEVVWSGGELLPPRPERPSPAFRHMLSDEQSARERWHEAQEEKRHNGVRTGRFCACGCGQEMVYSRKTHPKDMRGRFIPGHEARMKRLARERAGRAA